MKKMPKPLRNILHHEIDPAFKQRATYIFKTVDKVKPKKIFDAGCGRGFYVHSFSFFDDISEIHGIDVSDKYLKEARSHCKDKRIKLQKASIYSLPYKDNCFDMIISSEVMEHLDDDIKALKELRRVLKPNGTLVITVPNQNFPFLWDPLNWILMKFFNTHINKNIWWLAGIWADHERLYTIKELKNKCQEAGFKIQDTKCIVNHAWPFSHFLLYGIGKNIVERLPKSSFNRFNFDKSSLLSQLMSTCMELPSAWLDKADIKTSVNIAVTLEKK